MSRHAVMSYQAMTHRMNRDQTSLEDVRTVAEKIAFSFEVAVAELPKLEGYPTTQARVQRRVDELGNQLRLLSEYADEYSASFHVEEPPHLMRLHNAPAELLQGMVDELAKQDEWLQPGDQAALAYGDEPLTVLDPRAPEQRDADLFAAEVRETRENDRPI